MPIHTVVPGAPMPSIVPKYIAVCVATSPAAAAAEPALTSIARNARPLPEIASAPPVRPMSGAPALAGVQIGEHATGEVAEHDAVAAVAERVVDVADRADRAVAAQGQAERTRPAMRERHLRERGEVPGEHVLDRGPRPLGRGRG